MVKYFVKKRYEATELVTVAVGRIQEYYFGKNGPNSYICRDREPKSFEGALYGLDSKQEAEELLVSMQPKVEQENAAGYWEASLRVVEA